MRSLSLEPEDLEDADVVMSDALTEAVDHEMDYLEGRGLNLVRLRCREDSGEVVQATIHAGDEMYRLSEVDEGTVSRTVFRHPEPKGDENLLGAPSAGEEEADEPEEADSAEDGADEEDADEPEEADGEDDADEADVAGDDADGEDDADEADEAGEDDDDGGEDDEGAPDEAEQES
ncbi:MAG: hypothetical protein ACLFMT_07835 [Halobacteriales archaeon]